MADNLEITAGTGTTIAADEVGGAKYQRVKVVWGADGTANDANATTPLPVTIDTAQLSELATTQPAMSAGFQPVGIPSDHPAIQVTGNLTDDAAFTPGTSKVVMAGFEADEGSTDSVDEGDGGAARMTLDRKVITTPQPHTAGGLLIFRSIDLDEGAAEVVKNAAGQVYGMWVTNTATATRFVKFYNATSATVGTETPVITIGIPGNASDDVSGLFSSTHGIAFATGICVGASTGAADNDTGAPGAGDVIINVFYK